MSVFILQIDVNPPGYGDDWVSCFVGNRSHGHEGQESVGETAVMVAMVLCLSVSSAGIAADVKFSCQCCAVLPSILINDNTLTCRNNEVYNAYNSSAKGTGEINQTRRLAVT